MVNSTASLLPYWAEPRGLMIFRLLVEVTIATAGVTGNILVCMVIIKNLTPKKPINIYILSLASADLGVLLFNFPIAVSKEQSPTKYLFGRFFCLYIGPVTETFFCASIWSITAIAIDRYRNIVGANRMRGPSPLKTVRRAIVAIWSVAFVVASLPLYLITDYRDGFCMPVWPDAQGKNVMMQAYLISLTVVLYVLPLVVISFTYLRIRQQVSQSIRFRRGMREGFQGTMNDIQKSQLSNNEKTKKILSPLVIVFAITMFPITALRQAIPYVIVFISHKYFFVVFNVAVTCVIINSAINPILYYIVSKEFRLAYRQIINNLCKSCWQPFIVVLAKRWSSRRSSVGVHTDKNGLRNLSLDNAGKGIRNGNERRPFQIVSAV